MDKQEIRAELLKKRGSLTDAQAEDASHIIFERAIELPQIKDARIVLVYADFDQEVRTGELTGWLLYNGKKVALPVVEDDEMDAVQYRGNLHTTRFGYAEPIGGPDMDVNPDSIDVVICPGIAFSKDMDRIGFGKGYYDRFFARAPKAYRIGLAYDFQIVDEIPASAQDVKMDAVITPDGVLT